MSAKIGRPPAMARRLRILSSAASSNALSKEIPVPYAPGVKVVPHTKGGAVGVDMGRNIFQSDSPVGMIKAVRAIVHENLSVKEAYKIYESEKNTKARKAS